MERGSKQASKQAQNLARVGVIDGLVSSSKEGSPDILVKGDSWSYRGHLVGQMQDGISVKVISISDRI